MREHQNDYKNRHKKDVGQSTLIKHCKEKGHFFDFENVKVLHHEENFYRRRFLESSSIQYNKPLTVNYKTDTNNLNVLYSKILNKHRAFRKKTRKKVDWIFVILWFSFERNVLLFEFLMILCKFWISFFKEVFNFWYFCFSVSFEHLPTIYFWYKILIYIRFYLIKK
jgi:hypothetical protein